MGDVSDAVLASLNDDATVDDVNTTLVDESSVDDGLFASNYTVTLRLQMLRLQALFPMLPH